MGKIVYIPYSGNFLMFEIFAWPGDVHTLLLGAGSFLALMVVYAHRMAG